MSEDIDWIAIRFAVEAGAGDRIVARQFGVSANAVTLRAHKEDWGGRATRMRRDRVVKMLMKAGDRLTAAEGTAEVEQQARRVSALAGMAKALRSFDPRLAAAADAPAVNPEDSPEMRAQFAAEIEEMIEARVAERLEKRLGRPCS